MANATDEDYVSTRDALEDGTYRLLCWRASQVRLTLTAEQIAHLGEQTGYEGLQLDRAVQLIQDCQVPRWYVWRGNPAEHRLTPIET